MSETVLTIDRCRACSEALFPPRYRCPHCGAATWASEEAARGTIESSTVVRHRVGAQGAGEVHLASVRTESGVVVVARLDRPARTGEKVALTLDQSMRVLARLV